MYSLGVRKNSVSYENKVIRRLIIMEMLLKRFISNQSQQLALQQQILKSTSTEPSFTFSFVSYGKVNVKGINFPANIKYVLKIKSNNSNVKDVNATNACNVGNCINLGCDIALQQKLYSNNTYVAYLSYSTSCNSQPGTATYTSLNSLAI